MSLGVICVCIFVISSHATPITTPTSMSTIYAFSSSVMTSAALLASKTDNLTSRAETRPNANKTILKALKRSLAVVSEKFSSLALDVKRLESDQLRIADSFTLLTYNNKLVNETIRQLKKFLPGCPAKWRRRRHLCYKYSKCRKDCSANDAKRFCQTDGATLTSLKSAQLNAFINSLVNDTDSTTPFYYAGGRDDLVEGEWLWPDGSRAIYTNWDRNQPDNYAGDENCLMVVLRKGNPWDDVSCDFKNLVGVGGYVCEKTIWS